MSDILAPRHAALLEQAAMLFEEARSPEAIEILDDLHRRYPDHSGIKCLFLAVALAVNDFDLGLELARKLQDQELAPEVRLRVAWAIGGAGFPALALHHLNLIRKDKFPPDLEAELATLDESLHVDLKTYSPGLTRGSNFAIAMRWERVELARRDRNFAEAIRLAEALVLNIPDLFDARLSLAECSFELGDLEQAHLHASAAIELTNDKWRVEPVLILCELLLGLPRSTITFSPAPDFPGLALHLQTLLVAGETAAAAAYLDRVSPEMIAENPNPGNLIMALGFSARIAGRDGDLSMLARLSTLHEVEMAGDLGGAAMPYQQLVPGEIIGDLEPPFYDNPRVASAFQALAQKFSWLPRLGELLAKVSDQDGVVLALSIFDATGASDIAARLAEVASSDRFSFDFREKLAAELTKRGNGAGIVLRRKELAISFAWGELQVFEGPLPGETPAVLAALQEASELTVQGRFKRAESKLRDHIEERGPTAQLLHAISQVKLQAEEFEEAYEIWLHISEKFPKDAVCQLRLAECALDQGDIVQAEKLARRIFTSEPLPFHELTNCAFFLMRLGIELKEVELAEDGLHYLQDNPPDDPQTLDDLDEAEVIIRRLADEKRRTGRRAFGG